MSLNTADFFGIEIDLNAYFNDWVETVLALDSKGMDNIQTDVWMISRYSPTLPNYANILQSEVLHRLVNCFVADTAANYPQIDNIEQIAKDATEISVNAAATAFYINGDRVTNLDELKAAQEELVGEYLD